MTFWFKKHVNLKHVKSGYHFNAKLSYAYDVTASQSKGDMTGIQLAGKAKLLILKPNNTCSFYTTNTSHYEL